LREPSLALTRPWSPIGFGSRQVTVLYRWGEGRTFRTVPPAPLAGLVSFPPAPFAAALSFGERRCGSHLRWMLSLIPTVANCRDRH
jgi:hypothetical protein